MKTTIHTFKSTGLKAILLLICINAFHISSVAQINAAALSANVMEPESVKEQKQVLNHPWHIGTGIETYSPKDLHGTFYSAHVCMIKNRAAFTLGPVLQKRTGEINGGKLSFSYLLSDDDETCANKGELPDILQLKLYSYVQYLNNSKMSYQASRVETLTNPENKTDYSNLRFSTAEVALCAELDVNLKYVALRTYAGFSIFQHMNYNKSMMFHEKTCAGLVFGLGLCLHK